MFVNKKIRLFWGLLLVFLILSAGCAADARDRRTSSGTISTPAPPQATPIRTTYEVERGEVAYEITAPGRIVPVRESPLAFTADGVVQEVHVGRGDTVQAGDLLAELDTKPLQDEMLLAQTALAIAQTRLDTVTAELTAQRRLAEIAVEQAQLDLDFARAQAGEEPTEAQVHEIAKLALVLEAAEIELRPLEIEVDPALEADVRAAELRVAELEEAMTHMQLVAPFAGRITVLTLSPGDLVASQEGVGMIGDMSDMNISVGLQNNQLQVLTENMSTVMTPNNSPLNSYAGTITHLPQSDEENVRITFDDPQAVSDFELGERLRVRILIEAHDDALWLPPAAIRDFNGRKFVVILDDELQRRADVILGLESDHRVEILTGVEEGETVIAP